MLRPPARLTLFNRSNLVPHIRETILASTSHIHVITGPRSCGKTVTMEEAMEAAPIVVNVNCRIQDRMDRDRFLMGFRKSFDTAAKRTTSWVGRAAAAASSLGSLAGPAATLAARAAGMPDCAADAIGARAGVLTETGLKEIGKALSSVANSDGIFMELDAAIQEIHAKRGRLLIYIDELNLLQSYGNPEYEWRDELVRNLMTVLIRNTKERSKSTVVLSTSDQQYVAVMNGKADFSTHSLGYMGVKEIDEFLQIDWKGNPAVDKEEDRRKIIDSNGGFFPGLAKLRMAAKRGCLDDAILEMRLETARGLNDRLNGAICGEVRRPRREKLMRTRCRSALRNAAADLIEHGFVPVEKLKATAGEDVMWHLVARNLIQLRFGKPGPEGALWAPDLPEAARKIDVVTPYLPIDREWLCKL